ncbi:MAG: double-strand break repair protein AddB [Sphingopyxis sp.]
MQSPKLFTIPLNRAFADALVKGLTEQYGGTPLGLARGMVILPNRRAVAAIRDAFIRHGGQAMLLPRLVSLGDGDMDEAAGAAIDNIAEQGAVTASIAPMHRQIVLAQMIVKQRPDKPVAEAFRLAESAAKMIDQLLIEEIPLDHFCDLAPEADLAKHWDNAFLLLQSLLREWPKALDALNLTDRSDERNRLLAHSATRWRDHGLPAAFVVAAGISTSAPAIARLLNVIALAPNGAVVLSHIDKDMDAEQWDALGTDPRKATGDLSPNADGEQHPQFAMKLLLDRMGFHRDEVAIWPGGGKSPDPLRRVDFAQSMMAAAHYTADWPDILPSKRKLPGVSLYDLATPHQEALCIALAMRETLETPGKTAALVTPDRGIALRVAGHLARWGIAADDSAGTPLCNMAAGELILALVRAAVSGWAPVALVALLNHPLIAQGEGRREWIDHTRELDLILRGPRPAIGLDAIGNVIARKAGKNEQLIAWWHGVSKILTPLDDLAGGVALPLSAMLADVRALLDQLAGDALWTGADGRAAALFVEDLDRTATALSEPMLPKDLEPILREMMRAISVRPPHGGHPRLFIWGLIEARLQRADLMILSGLNEGQWPIKPSPDPWLAPMMRRRLGLPGMQRQTGLASHDFMCALGAAEVIITRSKRDSGAPTVASRLWLRMIALLGSKAAYEACRGLHASLAAALDSCAEPRPATRPILHPPRHKRPRALSVTEVDTLRADPFAFYARNALGLRPLDRLDAEPTAAWRGTAVHDVMEQWLKGKEWTIAALDKHFDVMLAGPETSPIMRAIWAPRIAIALRHFAEMIAEGLGEGRVPIIAASEQRGSIAIGGISLSGKADRFDRLVDGTLAVVDYKSGTSPGQKAVEAGYALQLGLLAMMAEQGAFPGAEGHVSLFEYWRSNRQPRTEQLGWKQQPFYKPTKNVVRRMNPDSFVAEARVIIEQSIARYLAGNEGFIAKLAPQFAPYADFDQLMRLEEWYGRGGHNPETTGDGA